MPRFPLLLLFLCPVDRCVQFVFQNLVSSCSEPLKAYFVQLAVISNHQNGRDTHIRQVKVFGPRQETMQRLMAHDFGFQTPEFLMFSVVR